MLNPKRKESKQASKKRFPVTVQFWAQVFMVPICVPGFFFKKSVVQFPQLPTVPSVAEARDPQAKASSSIADSYLGILLARFVQGCPGTIYWVFVLQCAHRNKHTSSTAFGAGAREGTALPRSSEGALCFVGPSRGPTRKGPGLPKQTRPSCCQGPASKSFEHASTGITVLSLKKVLQVAAGSWVGELFGTLFLLPPATTVWHACSP